MGWPLASQPFSQSTRLDELGGLQEFAIGAVQNVIEAVAVGLQHQLARLALPHRVHQHRHLQRVIVVGVVRRVLEPPFQLAGIGIERHDASL